MSKSLPQAAQTAKVNTLPDDLKKIAEEMLREKFGKEEVVESKSPGSFRTGFGPGAFAVDPRDLYIEPPMGRGRFEITTRPDFQTRGYISSVRVDEPDKRAILTGFDELRIRIPSIKETYLAGNPRFIDYLRRNEPAFLDSSMSWEPGAERLIGRIWGMKVVVDNSLVNGTVAVKHY